MKKGGWGVRAPSGRATTRAIIKSNARRIQTAFLSILYLDGALDHPFFTRLPRGLSVPHEFPAIDLNSLA
jgi:hypothetical protein